MIDLNLRSTWLLSIAASRHMLERRAGAIVNISSGASEMGLPYVAPYGAAKAGVNNLTKTFAGAWTPQGVRVNCIAVGAVASEGFLASMAKAGRDPSEVGAQSNAVGRPGEPVEIAYGILFLVSDAASFVFFAVCLGRMRAPSHPEDLSDQKASVRAALRFAVGNGPVRTTTLMFAAANVLVLVLNLVPHRTIVRGSAFPNDGLSLLTTPFLSNAVLGEAQRGHTAGGGLDPVVG